MNIKAKSKKINNNMKKEELIGKKVRGFRFEGTDYNPKMEVHIGEIGEIIEYKPKSNVYGVQFKSDAWYYPAERIEHHLIVEEENEKTKVVCTNTICQGECGECNYMEVVSKEKPKLTFTPIAMKCNQEQFDDIRLLLESGGCKINDITDFEEHPYLVNNFTHENKVISNVFKSMSEDFIRKVYHEWDKKTFLNACGIEWEEPSKEVNYNHISVRICEDNSLIGYYTEDCGITSFGKTFDELLRNLQHAKKAIEEARERLAKEDLERFEKSLDQSAEEFINDANRHIIENEIKENSNSIGIHKLEPTNPLDDLPIIGDGVLMEVSHCGNNWEQRNVWGKTTSNRYLTWDENFSNINLWKYARPITPKTKITRKEFEQKFEIID